MIKQSKHKPFFHSIIENQVELKFIEDYIIKKKIKKIMLINQRNEHKIDRGIHLDAAEISLSLPILRSIRYTAANSSRKIPSSAKLTPTSISKHLAIHQKKTKIF